MSEAPYPSDVRAKGWRFELDHERIRQSDTWALCPADYRPWLLMLWMVAWEQTPCGSMPDDDALIRARIGMTPKAFGKARASLMRGWWRADDGRLYHKVITERVLEMMEWRRKEAERKKGHRGKSAAGQESPAPVPRDIHWTDDTGTITITSNSVPNGTGGDAAVKRQKTPEQRRKSELWAAIKTLLVEQDEAKDLKAAGAIVTAAINRYDEPTALAAIEATLHKRPAGVIAYLEGACQQALGLRQNKQEALEASNDAVVQRLLAKENRNG